MSKLTDRLREVIRPAARDDVRSGNPSAYAEAPADRRSPGGGWAGPLDAAETLGGVWREMAGHRYLVVDRKYAPGHCHGRMVVADVLPSDDEPWARVSLLAGTTCRGRMLFVDLETTGLAGGAGSYAFLVGCAWFDGAVFRTRQFFLSSFAGERVLLDEVAALAASAGTIVSYNGKSFDLPLLETRFALNRLTTPFAAMPHVDMLHPARRLWRAAGDAGGCELTTIERTICGHAREGDVPGFEIPSRYFHYVRSGDARGLEAVMEHNRLDLLSLAFVTAHASQLLEEGPGAARTAREALGLGRLYERAGILGDAAAAFERAANIPGADTVTRAEALRARALLARRERRHDVAAAAWRRLLELRHCPPHVMREAAEALAVHHEHRLRDPRSAKTLALQSMRLHEAASRRQALQHRLARLERKIDGGAAASNPLF